MNFFLNKKVGILGLSRTGISSIKFLKKKGFDVFGWDDNKEILSKAKKNRLNIKNLNNTNLKKMEFLNSKFGNSRLREKYWHRNSRSNRETHG